MYKNVVLYNNSIQYGDYGEIQERIVYIKGTLKLNYTRFPELENLWCERMRLTSILELPKGLKKLYCNDNQLTSLPELPNELIILICNSNQLTKLPELPIGLKILDCANTQLTILPELPDRLENLYEI